jgi:hypothetical protein
VIATVRVMASRGGKWLMAGSRGGEWVLQPVVNLGEESQWRSYEMIYRCEIWAIMYVVRKYRIAGDIRRSVAVLVLDSLYVFLLYFASARVLVWSGALNLWPDTI